MIERFLDEDEKREVGLLEPTPKRATAKGKSCFRLLVIFLLFALLMLIYNGLRH